MKLYSACYNYPALFSDPGAILSFTHVAMIFRRIHVYTYSIYSDNDDTISIEPSSLWWWSSPLQPIIQGLGDGFETEKSK